MAFAQLLASQCRAVIGVLGLNQSACLRFEQAGKLPMTRLPALTRQKPRRAVHTPALDQAPDLTCGQVEPFGRSPLLQQALGRGLYDLEAVSFAQTHGDQSSILHGALRFRLRRYQYRSCQRTL